MATIPMQIRNIQLQTTLVCVILLFVMCQTLTLVNCTVNIVYKYMKYLLFEILECALQPQNQLLDMRLSFKSLICLNDAKSII